MDIACRGVRVALPRAVAAHVARGARRVRVRGPSRVAAPLTARDLRPQPPRPRPRPPPRPPAPRHPPPSRHQDQPRPRVDCEASYCSAWDCRRRDELYSGWSYAFCLTLRSSSPYAGNYVIFCLVLPKGIAMAGVGSHRFIVDSEEQ